jgi:hypothetical protein
MTLQKRIERLERRWGQAQFPKLTIEFFDKVLNGTITDEEWARHLPTLRRMGVLNRTFAVEGRFALNSSGSGR